MTQPISIPQEGDSDKHNCGKYEHDVVIWEGIGNIPMPITIPFTTLADMSSPSLILCPTTARMVEPVGSAKDETIKVRRKQASSLFMDRL